MIRRYLFGLIAAALVAIGGLTASPDEASAACTGTAVHGGAGHACFAIAAGNFNTSGTWSATSGGASCACVPANGDDIVFDTHSPTGTYSQNIASLSLNSLDASAATNIITISGTQGTTISGVYFFLPSNAVWSNTGGISFTSTGSASITTNGVSISSATFNGVGGTFTIGGSAWLTTGSTILTAGTLDFSVNNPTVTIGALSSNNSNTRTLHCGTGAWALTNGTGNVWDYSSVIGLASDCTGPTITVTNANPTASRAFVSGGQSFGTLSLAALNSASLATVGFQFEITGGATFSNVTVGAPQILALPQNVTVNITNSPNWAGSQTNPLWISAVFGNNPVTINSNAGQASLNWAIMQGVKFTQGGTATQGTATNSFDEGLNSGITITPPTFGVPRCISC